MVSTGVLEENPGKDLFRTIIRVVGLIWTAKKKNLGSPGRFEYKSNFKMWCF